jgi:hypothetical protein
MFGITVAKLGSYWLNRLGILETITKDQRYARTMARYFNPDKLLHKDEPLEEPWSEKTPETIRYRKLADEAWMQLGEEFNLKPA